MIVSGYGVRLIRLEHRDIELVRQMRNAEHVKRYMEYREHISREMQEDWFRKTDTIHNNYFIIEYKEEKIGLISGAQIDWEKMETGNGGIFIWEQEYWNTPVPLSASILLTDLSFALGFKCTYVRVLRDNPKAISFNKQLGYVLTDGQEQEYNQLYILREEAYLKSAEKIKQVLFRQHEKVIICEITNPEHPAEKNFLNHFEKLPAEKNHLFKIIK
jgi:UDP-4-amino-4,6-dideoxy-N-acetyl-beta-L-altrosamine N-acetyltransferase